MAIGRLGPSSQNFAFEDRPDFENDPPATSLRILPAPGPVTLPATVVDPSVPPVPIEPAVVPSVPREPAVVAAAVGASDPSETRTI